MKTHEFIGHRSTAIALGPLLAIVAIIAINGGALPSYTIYTVGLAAVYGATVLSVSLLAGWGGVWSVGHPAFLAIGAYTTAYGSAHGWSIEVIIPVTTIICAVLGAFLGFAGSRFSVLYIALLTLAFSLVALEVIGSWTSVTGGDQGIAVNQIPSLFGDIEIGGTQAACFAVVTFGILIAIATAARQSVLRMRLVAAKNSQVVSRTIGISPVAQVSGAFAVSAAATGIAGIGLALVSGFVSPLSFSLALAINFIAAAVLGGSGTISGSVIGGAFLAWAPTFSKGTGIDQPYLVGGILILALIVLPQGLAPAIGRAARFLVGLLPRRPFGSPRDDAERVEALSPALEPVDVSEAPADPEVVLTVEGLGVHYGGLKAIDGVAFTIRRAEVLAVIGPNGAGKTTLVNALSGLTPPSGTFGEVTLAGDRLTGVAPTRRRSRGLARTFQHAELFDELTLFENVLVTSRRGSRAAKEKATSMLTALGLDHAAHLRPTEVSFGLQKRVDLARALTEKASLLILDEPFGGLDADERQILAEFIGEQRRSGTSIIIIDHVLDDLFKVADRAIAFDFGELIAQAGPREIMLDDRVRTSYLGGGSTDVDPPKLQDGAPPLITLDRVTFAYPGVTALDEVSLQIPEGSIIGIAGANGAGKSTLGRLLHGTVRPQSGERTVHTLADGRAPRISLVPEGRALLKSLSIEENLVASGYGSGFRGNTLKARVEVGLEWLPERIRSRASVPGGALSGGEQQLVAIARALTAKPDVLILDEPALGLSPVMVDDVYGKISELAHHGVTTVILEQLLSRTLWASSRVLVLRTGLVVAEGDHHDAAFRHHAEREYFGTEAEERERIT